MEFLIENARGISHLIATRGPMRHFRPIHCREARIPHHDAEVSRSVIAPMTFQLARVVPSCTGKRLQKAQQLWCGQKASR